MLGDGDPDDALAQVQARSEPLSRAEARERQDHTALERQVASIEQRHAAAAAKADLLAADAASLEETTARLEADAATSRATLATATQRAENAQRVADEREQSRHRSAARAEALERALRDLQGAGGRELLSGVDGVVGSLLDLVEIDDGWEAAFEAAAGAGVAAVVVDGRQSAHQALATLRERGVTGAVLAPRAGAPSLDLPPGSRAEAVRSHVRARHGEAIAESVLNALIGHAVRVDGWEEAIDLSLARDDLIVVTPEGDRFAPTGWRVRSSTNVVTAAAVEDAQRRATEAAAAADAARADLAGARTASPRRARP